MRKFLILVLILFIILAVLGGWLLKIIFVSQKGEGIVKNFIVAQGAGASEISQELKNQELVDNSFIFKTLIWLKKSENKIKAGEHKIQDNWSLNKLINVLISGSSIENEMNITIIEGWDLRDIGYYLEDQGIAKAEEFWDIVGYPAIDYNRNLDLSRPIDFSQDYEFLKNKPKNISLEGYLFPDTYRIFKNSNVEFIVKKMLDNFNNKISDEMLREINVQGKTLHEILTLASIIEKEARQPEDKKRVAGVYYNRLKINMALQADPTANYVTGKKTDRPSLDDIGSDNPYNTYKYPGLPSGPICNPGLDSIRAAIYPEKNDYYYFINTPAGDMIFAKNFEEHKQNRLRYFNN